jgi:hypothetical protein
MFPFDVLSSILGPPPPMVPSNLDAVRHNATCNARAQKRCLATLPLRRRAIYSNAVWGQGK